MMRCRYCNGETVFVARLHGCGKSFETRECPACGLSGIYPFPDKSVIKQAMMQYLQHIPAFDPNFDWRLFFARRYLDDGMKVLNIGQKSEILATLFKKENLELVQEDALSHHDLYTFGDDEFDVVFVWDVLGFIKNIREFLKELRRITKKNGYVSIHSRDAFSRVNLSRGMDNYMLGDINFLGRKFICRLYRDWFNDLPRCFTQEIYGDSFITTLGNHNVDRRKQYSMNVLLVVHHYLFAKLDDATGPRGRVLNTIDMLDRYNVKADISLSMSPNVEGYDLVHLFHNAWETQDALSQMIATKECNKKVIVSTIYMDMSETNFIINTINKIFKIADTDEREAYLKVLSSGELRAGNLFQKMRFYAQWNLEEDQRALLEMADRIICFSYTEMRQMSLNLNRTAPFSIVYNSADDETFGVCGPEFFEEKFGVRDFIIAAGHIEWRKNQLMTLYALRDYPEIPIVIVGANANDEYYELCRYWSHKNTKFITQLKHRHLASAFAAARLHVQPSWIEGIALSTIEASMCGCTPVVSDRAGEIEYYGDLGMYVNPGSVSSIRKAVLKAYQNHTEVVRKKTREYVRSRYTFKKAVEMTIDAYNRVISEE